jgi:hypothetical protein
MQHLNTLWKAVNAASTVSELARQTQTFLFAVNGPLSLYLQAEHCEVRISRWAQPKIEVQAQLQAAFGWRLVTDQDEAGVYLVARRRAVVGGLSSAAFSLWVRPDTDLILKLNDGRIVIEGVEGLVNITPPIHDATGLVVKSSR